MIKSLLSSPWIHHVVTLIHICAALFWMGWIVFIFFMLIPVLKRQLPDAVERIMPALKRRVRKTVFWMILLIIATGLYNMYYRGLFDTDLLLNSAYGHRFLIKLGAAFTLFGVYFLAPYVNESDETEQASRKESGCNHDQSSTNVTGLILHVIAFTSGMVAALIGISLGG